MILFLIVTVISIFLDQIVKFFIENNLYGKSVDIIGNIFSFTYVQNRGAAWGIFSDNEMLLKVLVPALILVIAFYLYKTGENKLDYILGGLIVGGALSNFADRIFRGYVIDFLDFKFWPVFNIADICIVIGCILFAIRLIFSDSK